MRILVYPHDLTLGGSQINAIDLAAGVAERGHEVIVYGIPGPLVDYIEERGLRFLPAHDLKYRPAPSRIAQIAAISRRERLDLIHAYEWPPCLDSYFGAALALRVPLLCTVLSMQVMPHIPASVPLIMGTADLGDEARKRHRANVWVLEPPIDVERDNPQISGREFRSAHGVGNEEFLIVSVSRLALDLKLDALVRGIDAVDQLASSHPVKLILVGDGPARGALQCRADDVNRRHGREVVALIGADPDPRSAYAAADLVIAMGSSALRALAIGRPLIVQGEQAFSELFDQTSCELFLRQGFYGLADGASGPSRLVAQIAPLIQQPDRRSELGQFGREFVSERFALHRAVDFQLDVYKSVLKASPAARISEAVRAAGLAASVEIANHNPFQKRRNRNLQKTILSAARSGEWPPSF
ncbi:Glycosyltransferase involved in cell wall bisynthesis [Rhizobium tibeticum]|uniref:Glycosyltransferase involved in cell wall bisynthesis n=1 Tax=Rhizobium tibeticum TaxID=501024 RepID=A0A1H8IEI8_9HYPH|nr:glycosyltransferase family 4 protein [Rhizobium tibeticum]SEH70625.1 N-acetyl-alpha-D-glucosaminyl L-malate synthase BshA [Rhizobium tibeticum]SEN66711.1 Glycosyltransferase involved in cell wall bisynthesis [Rhizobium tibeticum]